MVSTNTSAVMETEVTVVGHSFIKRLRDDMLSARHTFEKDFGIAKVHVSFICKGGWKLHDVEHNLERIIYKAPTIIIFQSGGNDLGSSKSPEEVASHLLDIAITGRDASGAKMCLSMSGIAQKKRSIYQVRL